MNYSSKTNAHDVLRKLKTLYPEATCSLNFSKPIELVIAVMLSAQCTDERVNKITPELFSTYPEIVDLANADLKDIENIIHSAGFYKNKAKNTKATAQMILNDFDGKVPDTMENLIKLPGIGRKSANVIMLEVFNNPQGIAVDTHARRISNRIGLSKENDPDKIEQDLLKLYNKENLYDVNHLFVWHGRYTCTSRNPKCITCELKTNCKEFNK